MTAPYTRRLLPSFIWVCGIVISHTPVHGQFQTISAPLPDRLRFLLDTSGLSSSETISLSTRELKLRRIVSDSLFSGICNLGERTPSHFDITATQVIDNRRYEMRLSVWPQHPILQEPELRSMLLEYTLDSIPPAIYHRYFADTVRSVPDSDRVREWDFSVELGMEQWGIDAIIGGLPGGRDSLGEPIDVTTIAADCIECSDYGISMPRLSPIDSTSWKIYLQVGDRRKFLAMMRKLPDLSINIMLTISILHGHRTYRQSGIAVIHLLWEHDDE